jgi:hypothetical protein
MMKNLPKHILQFTPNRRHLKFFLCSWARPLNVMIGSLADFATFYAKRVLVFLRAARPFQY